MNSFPFSFWKLMMIASIASFSNSSGEILFSDDFDDPDGTLLPGKASDIGGLWSQTQGPNMSVNGGAIDTTGAGRVAFCDFTATFTGTERVLKITVDFSLLSLGEGYAGVSFFSQDEELLFLGDLNGSGNSLGMEGAPRRERAIAQPVTTGGLVTLTYDYQTGWTNLYAGAEATGAPLASAAYSPFLNFNRVRIANGNGSDIGVSEIFVETQEGGPPNVNIFGLDYQITRQGTNPRLIWDTSFADSVTISPTPGATTASGSSEIELPPGDTQFEISATDSLAGLTDTATTVARSVIGGEISYRYVRFNTVKTRNAGADFVQLAEFQFFSPTDQIRPNRVTNPGGVNPVVAEGPQSLIDNNPDTKWVDDAKAPLVFDFGNNPPAITEYSFVTAANLPEWDPVRWTMEGSHNGTTWELIENVTAFDLEMPLERRSPAPIIPFPGPSLIQIPVSLRIVDSTILQDTREVQLTWESIQGSSYRITSSQNLTDWSPIRSNIPGQAGTTSATATFEAAPRQFFRIELE